MTDDPTDDRRDGLPPARTADLSYEIDERESPSEAVVRSVATFTNTPILDLPPLYDVIDPDHLNGLFEDRSLDGGGVTFEYDGCEVTVTSGAVYFRRGEGDAD